jgi:hypothetical protein
MNVVTFAELNHNPAAGSVRLSSHYFRLLEFRIEMEIGPAAVWAFDFRTKTNADSLGGFEPDSCLLHFAIG